ncbi:MAG TPA: TIGR02530 family flagellar biosynthesis protein [Bacteroidota bacterium]|nr:TIGR02530 family flagellar biosynthesis protein [Bacteroidota bacterium]
MADISGISLPFMPIGGVDGLPARPTAPVAIPEERSFNKVLEKELQGIQFSKHAQSRLDARNVSLGTEDMAKLESAMQKAEAKGANDSLVLLRDMAFIVNVRNRTVVTTMTNDSMKEHVFTKIDSAIIAG